MLRKIGGLIGLHSEGVVSKLKAIDEEIDHHIAQLRLVLLDEGMPEEEAQREAARRFGDRNKIRAEMLGHSLRPDTRLRMVAVVAAAGLTLTASVMLGASVFRLNKAEAHISTLTDQMTVMRAEIRSDTPMDRLPMAQRLRFITLEGAFTRECVWAFEPREDITLRELVHRAGGVLESAEQLSVCRVEDGEIGDPVYITSQEWSDPDGPDVVLDGTYYIHAETATAQSDQGLRSGTVRLVGHKPL